MGAAAWGNLWNSRTRGASTVTMQLAGLLDQDLAMPQGGQQSRSVVAKIGQASTAWRLELQGRQVRLLLRRNQRQAPPHVHDQNG